MPFLRKNLVRPDEVRPFPNGRIEVFNLGDTVVGRAVYQPGWRWSTDVKPLAGTDACEVHHQGLVIPGRLRTVMSDGPEMELGPGDLFEIPSGHDAWVVGDEPWVSGADVRGVAVHTAARVMGAAGPDEVLASRVAHDLAGGSGLRFESRGPHSLKGLEEPMELFALIPRE